MGVTASLIRERVGHRARTLASDSQGGSTATFAAAVYVRGRFAVDAPTVEDLGGQLASRPTATVVLDPRDVTLAVGDRLVSQDGRTWDVLAVALTQSRAGVASTNDVAICHVVEVVL